MRRYRQAKLPVPGNAAPNQKKRGLFEDYKQKYKMNLSKTAILGTEEKWPL